MGTDHNIVIGWGYRIPIQVWNEFKSEHRKKWLEQARKEFDERKQARESKRQSKRRKIESKDLSSVESEESEESDEEFWFENYDVNDPDPQETCYIDAECGFEGFEHPNSHQRWEFYSQECTGDEGYIFIEDLQNQCEWLMGRKIGGALAWTCSQFEHMQNVSKLQFSIALEYPETMPDWKQEDGTWHEITQKRKDFLESIPEFIRQFIERFPPEKYYNRWIFGYAD